MKKRKIETMKIMKRWKIQKRREERRFIPCVVYFIALPRVRIIIMNYNYQSNEDKKENIASAGENTPPTSYI